MWQDEASCGSADPLLFFADSDGGDAVKRMRPIAEKYCTGCPALHACAADADDYRASGLWGGSYRTDRDQYRRVALIDNAPLHDLRERRPGAGARWSAA